MTNLKGDFIKDRNALSIPLKLLTLIIRASTFYSSLEQKQLQLCFDNLFIIILLDCLPVSTYSFSQAFKYRNAIHLERNQVLRDNSIITGAPDGGVWIPYPARKFSHIPHPAVGFWSYPASRMPFV